MPFKARVSTDYEAPCNMFIPFWNQSIFVDVLAEAHSLVTMDSSQP